MFVGARSDETVPHKVLQIGVVMKETFAVFCLILLMRSPKFIVSSKLTDYFNYLAAQNVLDQQKVRNKVLISSVSVPTLTFAPQKQLPPPLYTPNLITVG